MPINTSTVKATSNNDEHAASTSRKHHDIPLECLDYKYVETCSNVKELEKIYKVLV